MRAWMMLVVVAWFAACGQGSAPDGSEGGRCIGQLTDAGVFTEHCDQGLTCVHPATVMPGLPSPPMLGRRGATCEKCSNVAPADDPNGDCSAQLQTGPQPLDGGG